MSRFGFSTEPAAGDFLPICKYDARAGRMFRVDRVDTGNGFVSEPIDITDIFKAVVDFENVETGWISFAGSIPDFRLVPLGMALPARPAGQDDKGKPHYLNGIRFMLKLNKASGGDKPIREMAGTAKAFLNGVEKVFEEYEAKRAENPGKLPVIVLKGSTPIKSGSGATQSTNYVPRFEIVDWAPRGDLVFQPKGQTVPPSTGATKVSAPAPAKQPEPALEDDFG
jgi:hypothetical protein